MSAQEKHIIIAWVEQTFPLGEALAVGGVFSDGAAFHHGTTAEFVACMDASCWNLISEAVKQLCDTGFDTRQSLWAFENSLLWIATRENGAWLGVFTRRDLPQNERAIMHTRMADFAGVA
jgi:hypothetical protein